MTNEDVLNLVRRCRLKSGKVLIPNTAYLFKRRFLTRSGFKFYNNEEEIIVLVENEKRSVAFTAWEHTMCIVFCKKSIEVNT